MTATAPACFAVYSGLRRLGDVEKSGTQIWSAFDADGRIIGDFPDRAAAMAAVLKDTPQCKIGTTQ